ncbi:MAG TPA: RES family NAD+ phosphorylase [Candidatus Binataceae bacterium]|nr:RES family NAD+ phosphorylase [Candidatus Binataceae bacterium]
MELNSPATRVVRRGAYRLIPSRYPSAGILDTVATAADLEAVFELEGWTNDRISAELGLLHDIPKEEWVVGRPMATVVMAAFCHPRPEGGRFNDGRRGAWYAAFALRTAHAEAIFHRTAELEEIGGWFDTFVQMAEYLADFAAVFHDLRNPRFARYLAPDSYQASQRLSLELLEGGSNGIVYPSVRDRAGTCIACMRPRLVSNVRTGGFFEYRWSGRREPTVRRLN